MRNIKYLVVLIVSCLLIVSGCKNEPEIQISPAPIHEINISYAKSNPPQVLVSIKAGMPDGCTTFDDLKTDINGKTISITLTNKRPKEAVCTAIYGYYDKIENLGSSFIRGDTYTVKVNDKTTTFVMQ
jgi:inhibitor of cysteine peptidase